MIGNTARFITVSHTKKLCVFQFLFVDFVSFAQNILRIIVYIQTIQREKRGAGEGGGKHLWPNQRCIQTQSRTFSIVTVKLSHSENQRVASQYMGILIRQEGNITYTFWPILWYFQENEKINKGIFWVDKIPVVTCWSRREAILRSVQDYNAVRKK